ncbi:response regulator transcription factor [Streptomyces sp. NPDC047869]|uniref:response regulator transcription factor n=1 Tax=Streptomyces sp. NPDC047869 TaxID=3154709 RepID=UPI00345434AA
MLAVALKRVCRRKCGQKRWTGWPRQSSHVCNGERYTVLSERENSRSLDTLRDSESTGQPTAPGDSDAITDLTPREREVLLLLSRAASNRDIGRTLGIAERTVKAHLSSIKMKISVSSRTEAALFAFAYHLSIQCGGPYPAGRDRPRLGPQIPVYRPDARATPRPGTEPVACASCRVRR